MITPIKKGKKKKLAHCETDDCLKNDYTVSVGTAVTTEQAPPGPLYWSCYRNLFHRERFPVLDTMSTCF